MTSRNFEQFLTQNHYKGLIYVFRKCLMPLSLFLETVKIFQAIHFDMNKHLNVGTQKRCNQKSFEVISIFRNLWEKQASWFLSISGDKIIKLILKFKVLRKIDEGQRDNLGTTFKIPTTATTSSTFTTLLTGPTELSRFLILFCQILGIFFNPLAPYSLKVSRLGDGVRLR